MAKNPKRTNPIVLRQGMSVGTADAEHDDEFLFQCFIDHSSVSECVSVDSPRMIIAGRTGAGKTAILRHVERIAPENTLGIDPTEMSMTYVSNSDALRFVEAIGGDIDLLFQVLWKHILCLEFIRMRWKVMNSEKSKHWFFQIAQSFARDERKKKAINYLKKWEDKFWITMDQNVKEITEKVETGLSSEFGADIERFKIGGQYEKRLSSDKKIELVARSRKVINPDQLSELHGVIDILAKESSQDGLNYYILIDKLDERWADKAIRFRMIRALIESLRTFRKILNLKILVALRADVIERVVQETKDMSFQREKYEDYFIKIRWTKAELKSLINKRMQLLFKRQYSGSDILFEDIFCYKIGNQDPFDFMIERTLMRPRDIIAFVNECLSVSEGQTEVSASNMRRAEIEFSRKRLDALEQEWLSSFPTIRKLINFLATFKLSSLDFSVLLSRSFLDDLALLITTEGRQDFDPMFEYANSYVDQKQKDALVFLQHVVATLYRTGAIGVKLAPNERYLYSHVDEPLIAPARLTPFTRIRIHPMLHGAFRLN